MNQLRLDTCESGFNVRKVILWISVILLVGYGFFNARHLILGPSIELFVPSTLSFETATSTLIIQGVVKNSTYIGINERPIYKDTRGLFEEKLLLSEGSNIIIIRAKDRFGGEEKKTLNVYYKAD